VLDWGAFSDSFSQPFHVAHRWQAEEALVFSVEVRGVVVTDTVGRAGRVKALPKHEAAGFLKSQSLLELQGTHGRNRLEVVMEPRYAHPKFACDVIDTKRLIKILMEALNGPGDMGRVAA
jgi:hypothetical protein